MKKHYHHSPRYFAIMLCGVLLGAAFAVESNTAKKWNPRNDKTDIDYLFTTNGTAKLAHQLKSEEERIAEYKSRVKKAKAFWPKRTRGNKPVTLKSNHSSITLSPDGRVTLKLDGNVISEPYAIGWSIYDWTHERKERGRKVKDGIRTYLDNIAQSGPNEFML